MGRDERIAKLKGHAARCRQLSRETTNERTATSLRGMAEEGEAAVARLLQEPPGE